MGKPGADPMKGPRRRLEHGFEQLRALAREAARFMAGDPFGVQRERDPQSGECVWRAEVRFVPSDVLALIAGDCIHSFRASLDNLAWGIAEGPPPRNLAFPVCLDEGDCKWMSTFPKEIREAIGAVPPYQRPESERRSHPLYVLNRLWNNDKHRVPAIVGGVGLGSRLSAGGQPLVASHVHVGPFNDGEEIARCTVPQGLDPESDIRGEFAFSLAFEKGGPSLGLPLLETLSYLHDFVEHQVFAGIEAKL